MGLGSGLAPGRLALQSADRLRVKEPYLARVLIVKPLRLDRAGLEGFMAGSFDIFRKYQRTLLVAVAVLAMLAFFVLPPFLQMGSSPSFGDTVAVSWSGGSLRESELERAVAMQAAVNRFLVQSVQASGRDPSRLSLFPESEEGVVRTMLLAQEARDNGVVVTDRTVNDYLSQITSDMVRPQQLEAIMSGLRIGPTGVSQADLFAAIRNDRAAWASLIMSQAAFSGDPPGWRWEAFRRLEQAAVIEVVPVDVRGLSDEVPAPSEQVLRAFFEEHKGRLPEPASRDPGFREPHRIAAEYLVADMKKVEESVKGEVTDEAIAEFYEKNKERLFRATDATAADKAKDDGKTEKPDAKTPDSDKPDEKKPDEKKPEKAEDAAKEAGGDVKDGERIEREAKRLNLDDAATVPDPAKESKPADTPKKAEGAKATAEGSTSEEKGETKADEKKPAPEAAPAADSPKADTPESKPADPPSDGFEPLEKVKDRIRDQLVREKAEAKIDAIFTAAAGDVTGYAEDLAVWQARNDGRSPAPRRPDVTAIAKVQGLESGTTGMVDVRDASEVKGIGRSFEFTPDPGSRFGVRQQSWLEMMFVRGSQLLRPTPSRDVDGNRYLSWKVEDEPEFTPTFEEAKEGVDKAWRIIEARSLARRKAEEIAKKAESAKESLEKVVSGRTDVKATQVGPFTWLTQGTASLGGPPALSEPKGLDLPGEDFMKAVFSLEPGGTVVAFNEPETVCYCVRLVSYDPPVTELRQRFLDGRDDQSRLAMVSQRQYQRQFGEWIESLDKKYAVEWKRPPRSLRGE